MIRKTDLANLQHSWTAEVELHNNQVITIWYTDLWSSLDTIKNVLSVSSDFPKNEL